MTTGMKTAIAAGIVGAFGLGVWTAPHVRDINSTGPVDEVAVIAPAPERAPAARTADRADREPAPVPVTTLAASSEPVRKHVKPLLTWGSDTQKAAEGFTSAELFVTVAHAAKNTEVPFMLLKHRVLNEGQTLEAAIRASKPELDASLEADRARLEARADLSRMTD